MFIQHVVNLWLFGIYNSFIASYPSWLIHPRPFLTLSSIQASLLFQPAVTSQSETAPLLPKCRVWRCPVSLSRKKTLLKHFLFFSASAQEQQPKAEERRIHGLISMWARRQTSPWRFIYWGGTTMRMRSPLRVLTAAAASAVSEKESDMGAGVRSGRLILVSVSSKSEKYGRTR